MKYRDTLLLQLKVLSKGFFLNLVEIMLSSYSVALFQAMVVLFRHDSGAETPCKWCSQAVICVCEFRLLSTTCTEK